MDDKACALQAAAHGKETRGHDRAAVLLERFWPNDDVADVGLVLKRHKDHALCRSRPLPHQHEACDGDAGILTQVVAAKRGVTYGAERGEAFAEEAHRMLLQRQAGRYII